VCEGEGYRTQYQGEGLGFLRAAGSGPMVMGNWFSRLFHDLYRVLATAGKSVGTWQGEGGKARLLQEGDNP
jgi:hypothetical protein